MLSLTNFATALVAAAPRRFDCDLPMQASTSSRRAILHSAAVAVLLHQHPVLADDPSDSLPQYDESGRMTFGNGYSEETQFRTLNAGTGGSVRMLGAWTQKPDGSWTDPVLGSAATSVRISAQVTALESTAKLGRPERVTLVPALHLEEELARADLVAAAVRKEAGTEYYDFDLALPAKSCVPELATACLPVKVVLLSCTVRGGQLHVLQVDASADEWRRAGKALRSLRSTFTVA